MTHEPTAVHFNPSEELPRVRKISFADLWDALDKGYQDFRHKPSHVFFLAVIYPVIGLILGRLIFGYDILPLLFPLAAGFSLLGPIAAIGFYEVSRRREKGIDDSWWHVFELISSKSRWAILILGIVLMGIFFIWLFVAQEIYDSLISTTAPDSFTGFVTQVLYTENGQRLIVIGNAVGFLFALVIFAISVISFPLLIDRNVSAPVAIVTSLKAVFANPGVMLLWAIIIVGMMIAGSIVFLLGLVIVLPILGHTSWHLYRKVVVS